MVKKFDGVINLDVRDSVADWTPLLSKVNVAHVVSLV